MERSAKEMDMWSIERFQIIVDVAESCSRNAESGDPGTLTYDDKNDLKWLVQEGDVVNNRFLRHSDFISEWTKNKGESRHLNRRLGCLGTLAALILVAAGICIWRDPISPIGWLLTIPAGLFLYCRVRSNPLG